MHFGKLDNYRIGDSIIRKEAAWDQNSEKVKADDPVNNLICGGHCTSSDCGNYTCSVMCAMYCMYDKCGFDCGGNDAIDTNPISQCSSSSCSATGRNIFYLVIYVYIIIMII